MTHHVSRPIPAKRTYAMSRFTEDQWDMLQDGIDEERNARARVCWVCHGNGHNCPECADWEADEDESGEPVQENV